MTANEFRLSPKIVPSHYQLFLAPNIDTATFKGTVNIALAIQESTSIIRLNALDLVLGETNISIDSQSFLCETSYDIENELVSVTSPIPIPVGTAILTIKFDGILNDQLAGFYRSSYQDSDGSVRYLACTQFEATDARRAFPCFDEPALKAVFEVTLEIDNQYFAVSNGEIASQTDLGNGKKLVVFEPTISMSTYLLAFIVGDLVATAPAMVRGTAIRVVHRPGWENLTEFALKAASHALEFLTDFFAIPYPGTKLDLIAIPDFAAGAMENLGAVTFREALLLVDQNNASQPEKERIVDVVSHEIAHMWFGDLVTMKWWNGIWLNEAFATYMETLTTDHFEPSWGKWNTFGIYRATAQATDALHSTRPIEFEVERPADCKAMFDILTYEKGGSVLRMLEKHLGYESFRNGITHYLNKYLYSNAETTDLWDALEENTGQPVRALMDTWVFQGGFPLVSVERNNNSLDLSQEPFFYLRDHHGETAIGDSWIVPITVRDITNAAEVHNVLLKTLSANMVWSREKLPVVNAFGNGYFRVRYSNDLLTEILRSFDQLVELERFNLVSDAWAMVVANLNTYESFAKIARSYSGGTFKEPAGWAIISQGIQARAKAMGSHSNGGVIAFAREIFGPMFETLGELPIPGEPDIDGVLRANVIDILGTLVRDPQVVSMAQQAFRSDISRERHLEASLASSILHTIGANGDEADYAFILDRFKHPESPIEEQRYLDALSEFEQPGLIDRTLAMTLESIRSQDGPYVINKMLRKPESAAKTFDFVKENYEALKERFPKNSITRMLDGMSSLFGPEMADRASQVREFLGNIDVPEAGKTLSQIKERYEANLKLGERLRK